MPVEPLVRKRMSYDEWWVLPAHPKTEWVDGVAVMNIAASFHHQEVASRLMALLKTALPALIVVTDVGVCLPGNRIRIPDLTAVTQRPTGHFVEEPPVLVVEILSPSTRSEDLVVKAPEYLAAGIEQYWVVDLAEQTVEVFANAGSAWEPVALAGGDELEVEVAVGERGAVMVRVGEIFSA